MEKIYSLGKVYKITSGNSDKVYIGSTVKSLKERLSGHFYSFKKFLKGEVNNITSFEVLKEGDVKIELIEEFEDITRKELSKHEGKYIKEINCVNKKIEGRTYKEYNDDHKEEHRLYREQHHAEILAKKKAYREKNRALLCQKQKEYMERKKQELNKK
jgi:Uri superfamily endonuclease